MRILGKSILIVGAVFASCSANAENCSDYKAGLESLLVLPAGTYTVKYDADVPMKTIEDEKGNESTFSWWPDGRFNPFTYTYNIPRVQLKVVDSSTKGRRISTGNLSCTFDISYPPSGKSQSLDLDVKVSDSGNVTFLYDTSEAAAISPMLGALATLAGPMQFTNKNGQSYAFDLVSDYLKERDSAALAQHAREQYEQAYEAAAARQVKENAKAQELATPKEISCSKPAEHPSFWVSSREKHSSLQVRLHIRNNGEVEQIQFMGSSDPDFKTLGFEHLKQAAIDYYTNCQFSPGTDLRGFQIEGWTKEYTFQWGK